jgi:peptidoglycan/xylan/chitin deacetylase (PgdA/CDA1 family)
MSDSAPAALAAVLSGVAVCGAAWAVRGRSSAVFGPSHWRGHRGRRSVALTFDDGPSASTPLILEILSQYRVPATFFQIGRQVSDHPEIARRVHAEGHEIGNHSQTHPNFALKRPSYVASEFEMAQQTIIQTTGQTPGFLRAPYGVRWFGFRAAQRRLNLQGAMWSIIGRDWKLPAEAISRRVLSRVRPGDIICLHDGRGTLKDPDITPTVEAVKRIVPNLLEKGYHLETVTQLICPMK